MDAGEFRLQSNSAHATAMYMHEDDEDGNTQTLFLESLTAGDYVQLYSGPKKFGVIYEISAASFSSPAYTFDISATYPIGITDFANANKANFFFMINKAGAACFLGESLVKTPSGSVPLDTLKVGD